MNFYPSQHPANAPGFLLPSKCGLILKKVADIATMARKELKPGRPRWILRSSCGQSAHSLYGTDPAMVVSVRRAGEMDV